MHVRHPIWLQGLAAPGAGSFALLFALESATRALLATVIPLQVLALLEDPQAVSVVFFATAFCGLCLNFTIPLLVRLVSRRFTYSLGAVSLIAAAASMAAETLFSTALGMLLRVFGVACFAVCLNLYILDYIRGRELNRLEPLRLFMAGFAWTLGPWLGVFLWTRVSPELPFLLSAGCAAAVLAYFWFLRASDDRLIVRARTAPPNPLRGIGVFFRQPRLRLAWLIASVRSSWWVMFFIYAPVFAVESGLGAEAGGLMVSAGNALLFLAPVMGRLLQRHGVRWLLQRAFLFGGLMTLAVALLAPLLAVAAAAVLVLSASAAVALDVGGNLPFLRAVRPTQRAAMTTVFVTYRDTSEVVPPGLFALLLKVAPLPFVFAAGGIGLLTMAWYARYVPRRL